MSTALASVQALPSYLPEPDALAQVRARARRRAAMYRRRRLAAAAVALLLCAGVAVGLRHLTALALAPGADPADGSRDGVPTVPVAVVSVTVQPGDTLWAIARRLQPEGDVRPLVDTLVRMNGGAALEVGQAVSVPAEA